MSEATPPTGRSVHACECSTPLETQEGLVDRFIMAVYTPERCVPHLGMPRCPGSLALVFSLSLQTLHLPPSMPGIGFLLAGHEAWTVSSVTHRVREMVAVFPESMPWTVGAPHAPRVLVCPPSLGVPDAGGLELVSPSHARCGPGRSPFSYRARNFQQRSL